MTNDSKQKGQQLANIVERGEVHSGELLNRAKTIYAFQEIYGKYTNIGIHCSLIKGKLRQFNRISVLFSFPESYLTWIIKHKHIHNICKMMFIV